MTPQQTIPYRLLVALQAHGGSMPSIDALCIEASTRQCHANKWLDRLEKHDVIAISRDGKRHKVTLKDTSILKWHEVITGVSL